MPLVGIISKDSSGEEQFQVLGQTVTIILNRMKKQELELCQAEKYKAIAASKNKNLIFDIVECKDGPDFLISRAGERLGLDVAAFAYTKRRQAIAKFEIIKRRFKEYYDQGRLRSCEGINIQLRFREPIMPGPAQIEGEIEELVDKFETLKVDRHAWENINPDSIIGKAPPPFPLGQSGTTRDGSVDWHVQGLTDFSNIFSVECGFSVEHGYDFLATYEEIKKRLDEIVLKHDKESFDELAIIAGGPDRSGEAAFEENYLAERFVNTWKGKISEPKNIKRVALVVWGLDEIHLLYEKNDGHQS